MSSDYAVAGSLYLGAFQQLGTPHVALILPSDSDKGKLAHIRIDNNTGFWKRVVGPVKIKDSVSLTSLLEIRDATSSKGAFSEEQLSEIALTVDPPAGSEFGECVNWAMNAVQALAEKGHIAVSSKTKLREELLDFAAGNASYATSSKYPKIKKSAYCI